MRIADGESAGVHEHGTHRHEPAPAAYARMHAPPGVWTDSATLARGEAIYRSTASSVTASAGTVAVPAPRS
jgi:hypothetical protein